MIRLELVTFKMNFVKKDFERVTSSHIDFETLTEAKSFLNGLNYETENEVFKKRVVTKHGIYNLTACLKAA